MKGIAILKEHCFRSQAQRNEFHPLAESQWDYAPGGFKKKSHAGKERVPCDS